MLLVRYFWWLFVFQVAVFWRLKPWDFFLGIIALPIYLAISAMAGKEAQKEIVKGALNMLVESWEKGEIPRPPAFVKKRLLRLG